MDEAARHRGDAVLVLAKGGKTLATWHAAQPARAPARRARGGALAATRSDTAPSSSAGCSLRTPSIRHRHRCIDEWRGAHEAPRSSPPSARPSRGSAHARARSRPWTISSSIRRDGEGAAHELRGGAVILLALAACDWRTHEVLWRQARVYLRNWYIGLPAARLDASPCSTCWCSASGIGGFLGEITWYAAERLPYIAYIGARPARLHRLLDAPFFHGHLRRLRAHALSRRPGRASSAPRSSCRPRDHGRDPVGRGFMGTLGVTYAWHRPALVLDGSASCDAGPHAPPLVAKLPLLPACGPRARLRHGGPGRGLLFTSLHPHHRPAADEPADLPHRLPACGLVISDTYFPVNARQPLAPSPGRAQPGAPFLRRGPALAADRWAPRCAPASGWR